jgi:predicted ATPase
VALLGQYAPTWLEQMPALLSPADLEGVQRRGRGATRARMLRELAEAWAWVGQTDAALHVLDEALVVAHQTGQRVHEAELHRLTGELLLWQAGVAAGGLPRRAEGEGRFQQALDIARQQQAKSVELRAAMSLARLWQQQGKRTEAYALLAPVYHWFTEGFDTADLQEAKSLLAQLSRGS